MKEWTMRRFFLHLTAVLTLGFGLTGCSGGGDPGGPNVPPLPTIVGSVDAGPVSGRNLTLFTGSEEIPVDPSGEFEIDVWNEGLGGVGVVDDQDRVVFLSLGSGSRAAKSTADRMTLSARETVRSLVLLSPMWNVATQDELQVMSEMLVGLPEFDATVAEYVAFLQSGGALDLESARDSGFMVSLSGLLQSFEAELRQTVAENEGLRKSLEVGPYHGISVQLASQTATAATIKVTNSRRRWLSIWGAADNGGEPTELYLLPSPHVSVASAIVSWIRGESPIEIETGLLAVPAVGASSVTVQCYGLGLAGASADVNWDRVLLPAIGGVVFDVAAEAYQLIAAGPLEMRGRPQDHPAWTLVQRTTECCALHSAELIHELGNQQLVNGVVIIADCLFEEMTENPQATADIFIRMATNAGIAGVTRTVCARFLGPVQVVNYATGVGNLIWAAASIAASPPQVSLAVPLADIPIENDTQVGGRVIDQATGGNLAGVSVTVEADGIVIGSGTTGADGVFNLDLMSGSRVFTFAKPGYFVYVRRVEAPAGLSNWLGDIHLVPVARGVGSIGGAVIDAQTGSPISGFLMTLRRSGSDPAAPALVSTVTNSSGLFGFAELNAGTYDLAGTRSGYSDVAMTVAVLGGSSTALEDIVASRTVAAGGYRMVLTWGASPVDLDSHLLVRDLDGTSYEVRWNQRGSGSTLPYAWLDIDDVTSYGPETITVTARLGGIYSYAIYQYSSAGSMPTSGAMVELYDSSGLVHSWTVPYNGSGRWWHVFDVDTSTGVIVPINTLSSGAPSGMLSSKGVLKPQNDGS